MLKVTLKELLAKKRITFLSLSEITGISNVWLSNFANDHITLIQDEKIAKICLALNCTPNDLFTVIEKEITELVS